MTHQKQPPTDRPLLMEFVLLDDVSMLSVTSAIEPLRVANRLAGRACYDWRVVSLDGAPIRASNGLTLESNGAIGEGPLPDYTFICAGLCVDVENPNRLLAFLSRRHAAGVTIGAISMGTVLLARAGLLRGRTCTLHWESLPAFRDDNPDITVTDAIYEIDGRIVSCSGGMASLDLMLALIGQDHNKRLVDSIANQLQLNRIRTDKVVQSTGASRLPDTAPKQLRLACAILSENMETPLTLPDLAKSVGTSRRTLERMFAKHTGMTPAKFAKTQRLERARALLINSNLALLDIAVMTGFRSAAHFSSSFSAHFDIAPSLLRQSAP
ncbi:GlxA family transcriptional regulator [Tritonibacter multivorans]|nr:GlxA family transcriptional regulator [Tritonibacter multivorans]MDA7421100.1 GlxA family transcriptional regulator [Tritonibacter multivorans]